MAANYVKGNGQIENIYPGGEDPNSQDSRQVRLSVRFKPGDGPLDVKIRAYAGRDNPTQAAVHGIVPYDKAWISSKSMKTGLAKIKRQPPESRPPYRLR